MKICVESSFLITLAVLLATNEAKTVFFMLFSAFVHEMGHVIALRCMKIKIKSLKLSLFGGTLVLEKKLVSYSREIIIALSGATVNLLFSLIFFLFIQRGFNEDLFFLFMSNFVYAFFNLLPVTSLDGGFALKSFLSCFFDVYLTESISKAVSWLCLIFLAGVSIWLTSVSMFNVSLCVITVLLYAESVENHIISGYEFCRRTS